jgi:VanZ family protein
MFGKLTAVAAWALLAFIVYATISPLKGRPTLSNSTDIERFAAFAVLGGLFCLAYPRRTGLVCLIVLGSAALLEMLQLLTPDRHGRLLDGIARWLVVLLASWLVEQFFILSKPAAGSRISTGKQKLKRDE